MLVSYKYIAFEDEVIELIESQGDAEMHDTKPSCFTVKTDKPNEEYKLQWLRNEGIITCNCPFLTLNKMICAHGFCLMNALQLNVINYFDHLGNQWSDDVNPEDPSTKDMFLK